MGNMTEFGKSPLMTLEELEKCGVAMVLYPLSAFRAMSAAAELAYTTIRNDGTQRNILNQMQTRERLYEVLDYYKFEQQMDSIIQKSEQRYDN